MAWKLNRLRAMSAPETLHRARRWASQRAERYRVARGWQPRPATPVKPGTPLFGAGDDWLAAWEHRFELDHAKLDELVAGRLDLFAYESLDAGRPVNWHRDPLTGTEAPRVYGKHLDYRDASLVGDVKVLWELGRHQHLVPLAVAFAVTGESRYRDVLVGDIDSWVADNPFGVGVHWCSALEAALRLISWSAVHSLLVLREPGEGLLATSANPARLGESIYQQAWFVRHFLSRHSSANNHLIGELTGLFVATEVFDLGADGARWRTLAHTELEQQALAQVYDDGVNKEQAIYYHLWVLEYLLVAWLVGSRTGHGFSAAFQVRIGAMARFIEAVSTATGEPPQIGDADDGFVLRFEPRWPAHPYSDVLQAVAAVRRDAAARDDTAGQKAFWYERMAGDTLADEYAGAERLSRAAPLVYPDGGYAILGDARVRIVFDAGSLGYPSIAAHGHADALSFCLAIDDEWWLVDPGTYAYHNEGEWRDYFRGTAAHNTIAIEDRNQSTIGGPFLWLDHAPARLLKTKKANDKQIVTGEHAGYRRFGVRHVRSVAYCRDAAAVAVDDLLKTEKTVRPFRAAIYYHFAPDIELQLDAALCVARRPGRDTGLRFELPDDWHWSVQRGLEQPIQGWYSPRIGVRVPAPVLVGVREATNDCRAQTRIRLTGLTT